MRTWRCLRVILNGKCRLILPPDAHNGIVVQVQVGHFDMGKFTSLELLYRKAVILRGHFAQPGNAILHRVIKTPMAVVHFIGRQAARQGKYLVPQANAEQRAVCIQNFLYGFHCVRHHRGITGAIGNKIAVRLPFFHFGKTGFGRKHLDATTALRQASQDVRLDTEIKRCDTQGGSRVAHQLGFACAHLRRQLETIHRGHFVEFSLKLLGA